ncbi:MAG: hypothetical protein AAB675_00190 [Patescibacteria group bacterium]
MPKTKISSELVTKSYLTSTLKIELDIFESKIEEKITKFTDSILTAMDPLLKELEQRQEDRELASYQNEKVNIQLGDHEKRIKVLEQTV